MTEKELPSEVQKAIGVLQQYMKMNAEPEQLAYLLSILNLAGPPGTVHSELDDNEIVILSMMKAINNKYKSEVLRDFITDFIINRISRKRKSRMEFVDVSKHREEEEQGYMGRLKEAMGSFGD